MVEDAAESFGAICKGIQTGRYGDFNAISLLGNKSFTGNKNVTGMFGAKNGHGDKRVTGCYK